MQYFLSVNSHGVSFLEVKQTILMLCFYQILRGFSNEVGGSSGSGSREHQHEVLGDISNLTGRSSGSGYGESDNVPWEESFGEEGDFMGEVLALKRNSCSVGNFAAKIINIIFKPEELAGHNCTGTQGKERLDQAKMIIVNKYVFKMYPCSPCQEESL